MVSEQTEQGWQLEGSSPDAYERYLVPAFFERWAEELVELADPRSGERVLDVACGSGIVARRAARRVGENGSVTGLDINPGMLAVAREASSRIAWTEGSALSLPFPDESFDLVLCQEALQFFSDRALAFEEMHRVCASRGRLALSVLRGLEHSVAYTAFADALERHAGPDAGEMMRSPFVLGDAEELRALVTAAGFRDVRIQIRIRSVRYPSFEQMLWREAASSPLAGPLGRLDDAARGRLVAEIADALAAYVDDDGIVLPIEAHVVLARPRG